MANWIRNELRVTGSETDVAYFTLAAGQGRSPLSFAALVPFPTGLQPPSVATWARENWGPALDVGSDVGSARSDGVATYMFSTRAMPPIPYCRAASEEFPSLRFRMASVGEGLEVVSVASWVAGECVEDSGTQCDPSAFIDGIGHGGPGSLTALVDAAIGKGPGDGE